MDYHPEERSYFGRTNPCSRGVVLALHYDVSAMFISTSNIYATITRATHHLHIRETVGAEKIRHKFLKLTGGHVHQSVHEHTLSGDTAVELIAPPPGVFGRI
jgi:hypothetical protein